MSRSTVKKFMLGVKSGNTLRTVAKAETKGYLRAFRRVFDWQPRGRSG